MPRVPLLVRPALRVAALAVALPCALALPLLACATDRTLAEVTVEQDRVVMSDVPAPAQTGLDILVVVDTSPAFAAAQATTLAALATHLQLATRRAHPDWHLGVVRADLTDDAALHGPGLVGAPFLIDWTHLDERRTANYEGALGDAFVRLASLPTTGPARQQPLAAAARALAHAGNTGFRRRDAILVVVVIAAGDDASDGDPAAHVAALREHVDPRDGTLGLLVIHDGPTPRLDAALDAVGPRGYGRAEGLPAAALAEERTPLMLGGGFGVWGNPCVESALADTAPDEPGLQPDCTVTDVTTAPDDGRVRSQHAVQACADDPTARPCWELAADPVTCPAWGDHPPLELTVRRADYTPWTTTTQLRCVTTPDTPP